jgi:hypothetical protein
MDGTTTRQGSCWLALLVVPLVGLFIGTTAGTIVGTPGGLLESSAVAAPPARWQRGVALGLFSEDAGWSYGGLLDEIAALGADHVELVVPWYLHDVHASDIHDHPRLTPPRAAIVRTIREAHARGLEVLLFPIVRLEVQKNSDEWRGTLAPRDRSALLSSYQHALVRLAELAARERVALLSIGSEMSTLDVDHDAWVPIVAAVRKVYRGGLIYSGNWDHYQSVAIYDLVDYAGLCVYFPLGERGQPAGDEELRKRWQTLRDKLVAFATRLSRPLVFTEVGYLSQRGAAAWPWDEGASEPVDLEEQRRCYEAFRHTWQDEPPAGVYFWNWYGWGGPTSGGYTPRNKPAAGEIRRFFLPRGEASRPDRAPSSGSSGASGR